MECAGLKDLSPGSLHVILTRSDKSALELTPEAAATLQDVHLGKVSRAPNDRQSDSQDVSILAEIVQRSFTFFAMRYKQSCDHALRLHLTWDAPRLCRCKYDAATQCGAHCSGCEGRKLL